MRLIIIVICRDVSSYKTARRIFKHATHAHQNDPDLLCGHKLLSSACLTSLLSKASHEPASAPVSAPPRPLAVNFAGIGLKNTGKKSLMETLETLKVGPGYATCQFVVSGGVFNFYFFCRNPLGPREAFFSPVGL